MKRKFYELYNLIIEDLSKSVDENLSIDEIENIINNIKEKLNSPEFFQQNDRIKAKIIKYLNILKKDKSGNHENYEVLLNLLRKSPSDDGVGLNDAQSKELCNELEDEFEPGTVRSLINYLKNRTVSISDYCDGKKRPFTELFDKANLKSEQDKLISYLNNKQFVSLPSIGKSELLFSIIFSTAHRPGGKKTGESGDVIVKNSNLEVKGTGARLGGQSGYGKGFSAANFIKTKFLNLDAFKNNNDLKNKITDLDNISFNFDDQRISSVTNSFLMLCNVASKNDPTFNLEKAKNIMKGAFAQIFVNESAFNKALETSNFINCLEDNAESNNSDESNFENLSSYKELLKRKEILKKELDELKIKFKGIRNIEDVKRKNGEIKEVDNSILKLKQKFSSSTKFKINNENNKFFDAMLLFSLKYYQLIDGFSYFSLTNNSEFIILSVDQLGNKDAITNSIKMLAGISFSDSAGEQGGKVSIKLK